VRVAAIEERTHRGHKMRQRFAARDAPERHAFGQIAVDVEARSRGGR